MMDHRDEGIDWLSQGGLVRGKSLLCLVDGEHYPPVIRWALAALSDAGGEIAGVFFLGGTEKVDDIERDLTDPGESYQIYISHGVDEEAFDKQFIRALKESDTDMVVDLSDEPVVDSRRRFHLASLCLGANVPYMGSDFAFHPPPQHRILTEPSLAILGSGKRVGKTAISVTVARLLKDHGYRPVIVAMGRGGPPAPAVLQPESLDSRPETLISLTEQGLHAASDYWEDAILAGVPTVGCRRCGGGMAGSPFLSNVVEGAAQANQLGGDVIIMEGSGPTLPPIATDASILVVGAGQPLDNITGYLNEYKVWKSDLAVVTMCEKPIVGKEKLQAIQERLTGIHPEIEIAFTVFRPEPLGEITGRRVFVAISSPFAGAAGIREYLEAEYDCEVAGISTNLSDRPALREDLKHGLNQADCLLTEIKAASIDVAARMARDKQKEVVFLHNQPVLRGGTFDDLEGKVLALCEEIRLREPV